MNESFGNITESESLPTWEWIIKFVVLIPLNVLYVIILYVITKNPKDFSNSYFTLIKALAVTDFMEIVYDLHLFVYQWFGVYYLGEVFGKYFRLTAMTFAWYTNMILHLLIGINRFCAIVYFEKYKQLISNKVTIAAVIIANIYGVLCCAPWIYFCGLTLKSNPNYNPREYLLTCHPSVKFIYYILDVAVGIPIFTTLLISYAVAAVVSVKRLKSFVGSKAIYVREIKMMGQGFVLILILGVVLFVYHATIPGLLVNAKCFQIFYSSVNAIVYLMLDNKLRNHVYRLIFRCETNSKKVSNALSLEMPVQFVDKKE